MKNENEIKSVELMNYIEETGKKTLEWMSPDNTVGDFIITLCENIVDELVGEEALSMTICDVDKEDGPKRLIDAIKKNDKFGIFTELTVE